MEKLTLLIGGLGLAITNFVLMTGLIYYVASSLVKPRMRDHYPMIVCLSLGLTVAVVYMVKWYGAVQIVATR